MVKKTAAIANRKLFASGSYSTGWLYKRPVPEEQELPPQRQQVYAISTYTTAEDEEDERIHTLVEASDPSAGGPGASRLLNFTVTLEDFNRAMLEVPSSVNTEDYERMLTWKKANQS